MYVIRDGTALQDEHGRAAVPAAHRRRLRRRSPTPIKGFSGLSVKGWYHDLPAGRAHRRADRRRAEPASATPARLPPENECLPGLSANIYVREFPHGATQLVDGSGDGRGLDRRRSAKARSGWSSSTSTPTAERPDAQARHHAGIRRQDAVHRAHADAVLGRPSDVVAPARRVSALTADRSGGRRDGRAAQATRPFPCGRRARARIVDDRRPYARPTVWRDARPSASMDGLDDGDDRPAHGGAAAGIRSVARSRVVRAARAARALTAIVARPVGRATPRRPASRSCAFAGRGAAASTGPKRRRIAATRPAHDPAGRPRPDAVAVAAGSSVAPWSATSSRSIRRLRCSIGR